MLTTEIDLDWNDVLEFTPRNQDASHPRKAPSPPENLVCITSIFFQPDARTRALPEGDCYKGGSMTIRLSIALSLLSIAYFFCASCSLLKRETPLDKGYSLNNVLFVEMDLQSSAYSQYPKSLDFAQQAISRIEALPGVESAAVVDSLLTSDSYQSRKIYAEGASSSEMSLRYFAITSGYFRVMGIPLLR